MKNLTHKKLFTKYSTKEKGTEKRKSQNWVTSHKSRFENKKDKKAVWKNGPQNSLKNYASRKKAPTKRYFLKKSCVKRRSLLKIRWPKKGNWGCEEYELWQKS